MRCFRAIRALEDATEDMRQVAREIYYSISQLKKDHPANANLEQALQILGVYEPKDVGLSNSMLNKRDKR